VSFDAAVYKASTREQWQAAAAAWHRWGPQLEDWLGDATELMLDLAGVSLGSRVLDIAAGAGGQTLAAARRAGPEGAVLATDISPAILEFAAAEARRAGLGNVTTSEQDAERLDVQPRSFDAAISRLGYMYLPDLPAALAGVRRALRPGGRVSAIVFATPDQNRFFSVPVAIARRRAGLPAPGARQPGPFSLGADGALAAAYAAADFQEPEVRSVEAPLRMASAAACAKFERESFGALHQMLSGLHESEQEETWAEIEGALREFEGVQGFEAPCRLLVGAARVAG
jgi:SAM-dependent methyltransferase